MSSNAAKTHSENRFKVCLICFQKGSSMQPIGETALQRIKTLFLPNFDLSDESFPAALCARCQRLLMKIDRGEESINRLPNPIAFSTTIPKLTRSNPLCCCEMCQIARSNPIGEGLGTCKPRPHPLGRPPATDHVDPLPPASSVMTCQRCHSVIGRGLSHICTVTQRRENLFHEWSLDERGAEIHASSTIKFKFSTNSRESSSYVTLATRGRDMTVSVSSRGSFDSTGACGVGSVPAEEVSRFQRALNLSRRQTKLAAQFIRSWHGKGAFEANLDERLRKLDETLDSFYEVTGLVLGVEGGARQQRPVVFCNDVPGLVDIILQHRGVPPGTYLMKIGLDSGGSFLKVCLNIVSIVDQPSSAGDSQAAQLHAGPAEGGVKNLIILAIVEKAVESYDNLTAILALLSLSELAFCMAVDMKMANALLGLQSCSSSYPCPWCETPRGQFSDPSRTARLRTFGDIRTNASHYQQQSQHCGSSKPSAVAFKNCVRPPLLSLPDNVLVLEAIPPMELHLLLGIVNKLYNELDSRLRMAGHQMQADDWATRVGVKRAAYHGGQFKGNECERLLDSVDILEQMLYSQAALSCIPIVRAFRCFRAVKQQCFGMKLGANYEKAISDFSTAFGDLEINVTPKVHAVTVHVPQFLSMTNASLNSPSAARGLGFWSEQSVESSHHDFSRLWTQCYRVNNSNAEYPERLRKCIVVYCSRHL